MKNITGIGGFFFRSKKPEADMEWILDRVCAVGPDNIHDSQVIDEDFLQHKDDIEKLNPKRYQVIGKDTK